MQRCNALAYLGYEETLQAMRKTREKQVLDDNEGEQEAEGGEEDREGDEKSEHASTA